MISGPVATRILGDQGADVIEVEPRTGERTRGFGGALRKMSPLFATTHRCKRSAVHERLVAPVDVFVQSFQPGAAERMGIGEPALRAVNPRLIYVSISGFGESGPYAHKRVYDRRSRAWPRSRAARAGTRACCA